MNLQARTIEQTEELPTELDMYLSQEAFESSKEVAKKKLKLHNCEAAYGALVYTMSYMNNTLYRTWEMSKTLSDSDCLRSVIFVTVLTAMNSISVFIMSLLQIVVEGWKSYQSISCEINLKS
ncbi:hypothetical protein AAG570_013906 [Ranatra chinensis]|uniref:CAAX prenyl protease 1 N-terminal domain-containing protein n=1 Tax=Ranatra chinensis TaxID=642074 RepID=A0ABD0YFG4_9HEMI